MQAGKAIWKVLVTPPNGSAADLSHFVQNMTVTDAMITTSGSFDVTLWDWMNSGILSKYDIGAKVEIWSDTRWSSSNVQAQDTVDIGASETSSPSESYPVKSYGSVTSGETTHIQTSTSITGVYWTPWIPLGANGEIQSPPYRWIRFQTDSGFTGSSITFTYQAMPKRIKGFVNNKQTSEEGSTVLYLELQGLDWSAKTQFTKVSKSYAANQDASAVIKDMISTYMPDVTVNNVNAGTILGTAMQFSQTSMSQALTQLANTTGWVWFIDANGDMNWVDAWQNKNPVTLSNRSGGNIVKGTAQVQSDGSQMKNKITFYGGTNTNTISEFQAGNGQTRTFTFSYSIQSVTNNEVIVDGSAQAVGIDGTDTGMDWYYTPGQKYLRQDSSGTVLQPTDVLELEYSYNMPTTIQMQDDTSIAKYGTFEDIITDSSTTNLAQAQQAIQSELKLYAYPIVYAKASTYDPTYSSGQLITYDVPDQGAANMQCITSQVVHQMSTSDLYVAQVTAAGKGS